MHRWSVDVQSDAHRQAATGGGIGDHRPAHRLDEAACHGQSESESLGVSIVEALEGLEELSGLRCVDAATVVDHLELDALAAVASPDLNQSLAGAMPEGVVEDIHEHALKQPGVRLDEWHVLGDFDRDSRVRIGQSD